MYEHEEVEETEGKELAQELHAIFQKTSAKEATGVEDLFISIGKKFLNPSANDDELKEAPKPEIREDKKKIKLERPKVEEKKKKGCC